MTLVYFITHPNVVVDPAVPITQWSLSDRGIERMRLSLNQPWIRTINAVFSSNERKAVDAAKILSTHCGIAPLTNQWLGEIDRSSTGYMPFDELMTTVEEFYRHPAASVRGWESAQSVQKRVVDSVDHIIASQHGKNGNIAIVSHGCAMALALCHLKGREISMMEEQPGTSGGCYYCYCTQSRSITHSWKLLEDIPE